MRFKKPILILIYYIPSITYLGMNILQTKHTKTNQAYQSEIIYICYILESLYRYIGTLKEGLYRYIGYLNNCPIKSNNIGYWTPIAILGLINVVQSYSNVERRRWLMKYIHGRRCFPDEIPSGFKDLSTKFQTFRLSGFHFWRL